MEQTLLSGAARRKITPPDELLPRLRGLMNLKFAAIADDIYVRALAVRGGEDTALFVGFDLDKAPFPEENMERIRARFGVPVENITYYGIHTHSAPILGARPGEAHNHGAGNDPEVAEATGQYGELVNRALMEAVEEALDNLKPARIGHGKGPSGCNINRCLTLHVTDRDGNPAETVCEGPNALGPVDNNVYVMKVEDLAGNPVAFLVNYAVHNTLLFGNNYDGEGGMAVSGDLGGTVSGMLEQRYPGAVALWCSGPAGDAAPLRPNAHPDKDAPGSPEYAQKRAVLDQMCRNHCADIQRVIEGIDHSVSTATVACGVAFTSTPARRVIREGKPPHQTVRVEDGPDIPPYRIRVHMTRIGALAFCGIGGELFAAHAFEIQKHAPLSNLVVINHDASMIDDAGYIMDDDTWHRVARAPAGMRTLPGAPPRYRDGHIAGALVRLTGEMLENLL